MNLSRYLTARFLFFNFVSQQEKSQETLDFILTEIGRMDSEKHSLVLKEVISLTSKYPQLLTLAVINRVSSLDEGGATLATKTCIQELKNEFNHLVSLDLVETRHLGKY